MPSTDASDGCRRRVPSIAVVEVRVGGLVARARCGEDAVHAASVEACSSSSGLTLVSETSGPSDFAWASTRDAATAMALGEGT